MLDFRHYTPILRGRKAEFGALFETTGTVKAMMTPLMEVQMITLKYKKGDPVGYLSKTLENHLLGFAKELTKSWGTTDRIFVDSSELAQEQTMADGSHHLGFLFNELRAKGSQAIPVTGILRHGTYQSAVLQIVQTDKRGLCLRLTRNDLDNNSNLLGSIDRQLAFFDLSPEAVDLIIDYRSIEDEDCNALATHLAGRINSLPHLQRWRTFTVATSAFPFNLVQVQRNQMQMIGRADWLCWNQLLTLPLKRKPAYGDYAISHPDMVIMDPRKMRVSAGIRYTLDNDWLIVKGQGLRTTAGFDQYHSLSRDLILRPEYSGPAFSWGDEYINECANRRVGTGNPTIWRKVGNNHHFRKTVTQISNIP